MKSNYVKGFTLIELLISLSIVSLLLALAAPSYSRIIRDTRMQTQISDFHRSLLLARNEAIKRGSRITVCRSRDGRSCSAQSWSQGWIVFSDSDHDLKLDEEELLQVREALDGGNSLTGNRPVARYISYVANGRTRRTSGGLQMGTFILCDERGFNYGRAIVINAAGRPSIRAANRSSFEDCGIP